MTIQEAIKKFVDWGEAQVGYKAKSNKWNKYAEYIDKHPDFYNYDKQYVDWCDLFYDVGLCQCFTVETARKMLYQPKNSTGAGCGFSAGFYRENGAWAKNPQIGAQIFYGKVGNESHTGMVVDIQGNYIYTVEGNTGGGGGEVQRKKVSRSSSNIAGYGIPNWSLVATKFTKQWGIDISEWQYNYDLAKAQKEGVRFVIIRGGGGDSDSGLYVDARFEENYAKAKALKMPVGVYWFSKALNETQAKSEAEFFYNKCLKGKQFELPIYIDVENKTQLAIGKRKLTDVILTWLKYIRARGYWVGIYSSLSYFSSYMYDKELQNYAHWVACWAKTCSYEPKSAFGLWQFGGETNPIRSNKVAGKTTDQNYLLIDYEPQIKARGLNGWSKSTPAPTPKYQLDVDGVLGYNSVIAMQKWVGTYQDGEITGQLQAQNKYYPALINYKNGGGGSSCIKAIQKLLIKNDISVGGSGADGILGQDTIKGIQKFLNKNGSKLNVNGLLDSTTAKELQKYLNKTVYK